MDVSRLTQYMQGWIWEIIQGINLLWSLSRVHDLIIFQSRRGFNEDRSGPNSDICSTEIWSYGLYRPGKSSQPASYRDDCFISVYCLEIINHKFSFLIYYPLTTYIRALSDVQLV
jgi:hypothetical protein